MAIEGRLRDLALHDLLQLLYLSRKTGKLRVINETGGRGSITLKSGAVVSAEVEEASPRLGHLLLNAGKITEADLRRADQAYSRDRTRSWRDIFQALGVVNEEDLDRFVKFQVEECIYEILGWQEGGFSFADREVEDSESVTLIPVESLLMEGARRADELSVLAETVESPKAVPKLSARAVEGGVLDLTPQEWEVLGRVDGVATVKSIAWSLGRNELEISKVVARLLELGLLEIESQDAGFVRSLQQVTLDHAERMIQRDEISRARRQIEAVLQHNPEDPRAHVLAARALEKSGNLLGAAEEYERALSVDPDVAEARQRLGVLRLRLGHIDGAAREWTSYLEMAPESADRARIERALAAVRELQCVLGELDGREHT